MKQLTLDNTTLNFIPKCYNLYQKQWYQQNKERIKKKLKNEYWNNPEKYRKKARERGRELYWNDPEKYRERARESQKKHIERYKEYQKQYYKQNKKQIMTQQKQYRKDHPEYRKKQSIYQRKYIKSHPEIRRKIRKQWKKNNPEKVKENRRKYRHNRRKGKKFISLLDNPFPTDIEVDYHHINNFFVMPVPKQIHQYKLGILEEHLDYNKQWINKLYSMDVDLFLKV